MSNLIDPINDGPLKLDAETNPLRYHDEDIEFTAPAFLCRCGASAKKPFCDGSHKGIGYSSDRESTDEKIQDYQGERARILFNRSICSGAARCVGSLPEVFRSDSSDNWIHPDSGEIADIRRVVGDCPSGALSMSLEGAPVPPVTRVDPSIEIVRNGPYIVEAIELRGVEWHTEANTTKYALCRCGLSKNKPFCDYSHAEKGWKDSE